MLQVLFMNKLKMNISNKINELRQTEGIFL